LHAGPKVTPQQRLFDKELDNQHEEPVLLAQLAGEQLRTLLLDMTDDAAGLGVVVEWAARLVQVSRRPCSGGNPKLKLKLHRAGRQPHCVLCRAVTVVNDNRPGHCSLSSATKIGSARCCWAYVFRRRQCDTIGAPLQDVKGAMSETAAPVVVGAADFVALYRPLLGLWATGGCRAISSQLPHVPADLALMADATRRRGRVHPLLGNTLVRPVAVTRSTLVQAPAGQPSSPALRHAFIVLVMHGPC